VQRLVLQLVLLAASAFNSASALPAPSPQHPDSRDLRTEVAAIAQEAYATGLYIGVSVAAASVDGEVMHVGVGFADAQSEREITSQTMFRMYSVSKGLTALLAERLAAQGKLQLGAPIDLYLPNLPEHLRDITARQLLDHSSGIRHYKGTDEWLQLSRQNCTTPSQAIEAFKADPLVFKPGERVAYSSFGYVLLSAVIEQAGGKPFSTLMQTLIFEPSGAQRIELDQPRSNTSTDVSIYYEKQPDAGGRLTPQEAPPIDNSCKFGGGAVNASPQAVADIYRAYLRDVRRAESRAGQEGPFSVGGEGLGGRSIAYADPKSGVIVVIAANARGGNLEPYARRIAEAIAAAR
jgi:serine beta-lactamase-like protein LACTB, mitochondrial